MKKTIIKTIITAMFVSIIFTNFAMAIDFDAADAFIKKGGEEAGLSSSDLETIGNEFADIGNVLKFIGAGIIVGATAYMGILYMISPPERQAKLKLQLIGLVSATTVIFAGYYIWEIITNALDSITKPA